MGNIGHVYTMSTNAPVVKDVLQDIMNIIKGISLKILRKYAHNQQ